MSGQLATAMTSMQMAYCFVSVLLGPVFFLAIVAPAVALLACALFTLWALSLAFGLPALTAVVSWRAKALEGKGRMAVAWHACRLRAHPTLFTAELQAIWQRFRNEQVNSVMICPRWPSGARLPGEQLGTLPAAAIGLSDPPSQVS